MTPTIRAMAWFWQTWLVAVVFIFPIPHTIALRNLLLLIGLLALLPPLTRATRLPLPPALKPAAWGLAAATAWLLLHSLAVAPAPTFVSGHSGIGGLQESGRIPDEKSGILSKPQIS